MIPKKELKFFIRYLKDNKLFAAFKRDTEKSIMYGKTPYKFFINKEGAHCSIHIIMDCVLWSMSSYLEWGEIYSDYRRHFEKNYLRKK